MKLKKKAVVSKIENVIAWGSEIAHTGGHNDPYMIEQHDYSIEKKL